MKKQIAMMIGVIMLLMSSACWADEDSKKTQSEPPAQNVENKTESPSENASQTKNGPTTEKDMGIGKKIEIKPESGDSKTFGKTVGKEVLPDIFGITGERWMELLQLVPLFEKREDKKLLLVSLKKELQEYETAQLLKPPIQSEDPIYVINKRTNRIGPTPMTLSLIEPLNIMDHEAMQMANIIYTITEKKMILFKAPQKDTATVVIVSKDSSKSETIDPYLKQASLDKTRVELLAKFLVYLAHDANYGVPLPRAGDYLIEQLKAGKDVDFIISGMEKLPIRKTRR